MIKSERNHAQHGQAYLELALILPALLLLTLGVLDFGRSLYTYVSMAGAVRDGARYGTVYLPNSGPPTPSQIQSRVQSSATSPAIAANNVSVQLQLCRLSDNSCVTYDDAYYNSHVTSTTLMKGYRLNVQVSYTFQLLTPLLGQLTIPMGTSSTMVFLI